VKRPLLRPAASGDLAGIWNYGSDTWGMESADAYLRAIDEALKQVARHPERGSDRSHVMPGLRKADVASHHAYYLMIADGIDVIRILHPKMDVQTAVTLP
jgi:toxin ParE1/3/4